MITFKQIVDSSNGSEETMHASVEHVSNFVEKVAMTQPHLAKTFLQEQYELMNGQHFNEWLAKKVVSEMWHTAADGKTEVTGEIISQANAVSGVLAGKLTEEREKYGWDAYVAANTYAHDLAHANLDVPMLMKLTREFWFNDEDFTDGNKIYWYHSSKKGIWK